MMRSQSNGIYFFGFVFYAYAFLFWISEKNQR